MTIQECITNNFINDKNLILVFPTDIAAKRWADWTVSNTELKAVAMERFTAWDKFKGECIKSTQQNKTSIPSIMRKVFASWVIQKNAENNGKLFGSLIKKDYITSSSSFADWISSILPSLGTWKKFHDNIEYQKKLEEKFGKSSEALLEEYDYEILYKEYSDFLDAFSYFEPAWEQPPFNPQGNKYVIIYPEILEDYCEYRQILDAAVKEGILSIISVPENNDNYLVDFEDNSRTELQNVALYMRKKHEEGIPWSEMALNVPDMDRYGSYLDRELDLHEIPHTMRYSKPLTTYGAGQVFNQIQNCCQRNFSFESIKTLFLNEDIPWKNKYLINKLIEFGQNNNCIVSFGKNDIWETSFLQPKDKTMLLDTSDESLLSELKNFYHSIKICCMRFQKATDFKKLYDAYNEFKKTLINESEFQPILDSNGMETPSEFERSNKILGRCITELKNLAELEKDIKNNNNLDREKYKVRSPFTFWLNNLKNTQYLEQSSTSTVQVYSYRTASSAPFTLQIVVDSTQNSLSLSTKALKFLSDEKREIIKNIDGSYNDIDTGSLFIALYKANSREKVLFSGSTHSFGAYGFLHAAIESKDHKLTASNIENNLYKTEKDWFLQKNPDAPEILYEKSAEGFRNWISQQGIPAAISNKETAGPALAEIIKQKFFDDSTKTYRISYTTMKNFYTCPRRWLFKDVLGLRPLDNESELKDSFIDGTVKHMVFQNYFKAFENKFITETVQEDTLKKSFEDAIASFSAINSDSWKNSASFMTMEIFRSDKNRLQEDIRNSIESFCKIFNGWKVYATEKELNSVVPDKEYSFTGSVDLILYQEAFDEENNKTITTYKIVDYKSSKNSIPKVHYVSEKKFNENIDFQIPMYVYLCNRSEEKISISNSEFYNIKDGKTDTNGPVCIFDNTTDSTMNEFLEKADNFFENAIKNQKYLVDMIFQNKNVCSDANMFSSNCSDYRPICRRFFTVSGEIETASNISTFRTIPEDKITAKNGKRKLSDEQNGAKSEMKNVVVSAGAGSGKTTVLSERFEKIVQDGTPVDKILTLTFTNKAANEMKSRIFKKLSDDGLSTADFDKAHIQTLDSYFSEIAKQGAHFYGVTPAFQMDKSGIESEISHSALKFLLEKKDDPEYSDVIIKLSRISPFETLAENIFALPLIKYDNLCNPLDFSKAIDIQSQRMANLFMEKGTAALEHLKSIKEVYEADADTYNKMASGNKPNKKIESLVNCLTQYEIPELPCVTKDSFKNPEDCNKITNFLFELFNFTEIERPTSSQRSEVYEKYKSFLLEFLNNYKDLIYVENFIASYETKKKTIELVTQFQKHVNDFKRTSGCLTFTDISELARKTLIEHPEIRHREQNKYDKIMIDEFQDNNQQQCDVLFMLADQQNKEKYDSQGNYLIPDYDELTTRLFPEKLFFVGDEKQSIYSFRGSDVTVFNRLKEKLGNQKNLNTNYRSEKSLIDAFNVIFGGNPEDKEAPSIFMTPGIKDAWNIHNDHKINALLENEPAYIYTQSDASKKASSEHLIKIAMLKKESVINDESEKDTDQPDSDATNEEESANVYEARWIAREINRLVGTEYKDSLGNTRYYRYQDFCLLFRSTSNLDKFESELLHAGIPYSTEVYKGFFSDGPINDLISYLKLCVYSTDLNAYAKVLCSPFVNLSLTEMEQVIAYTKVRNKEINKYNHQPEIAAEQKIPLFEPFDQRILTEMKDLSENARQKLTKSILEFQKTKNILSSQKLTKTISHLWYDLGYRYETMWNQEVAMYSSLYDILFEIARKSEENTQGLALFLDEIEIYKDSSTKIDDLDIPMEASDSVKIMTIHKSKGLEFKVVFFCGISNGNNKGKTDNDSVSFTPESNLIIKTSESVNKSALCKNLKGKLSVKSNADYFIDEYITEQNFKNCAELRRINYVACTRAERILYLVGHYAKKYNGQFIASEKNPPCVFQPGILGEEIPGASEPLVYHNPNTFYEQFMPLFEYYTTLTEDGKRVEKPNAPFEYIEFTSAQLSEQKNENCQEIASDSLLLLRSNTKEEKLKFQEEAKTVYNNPELRVISMEHPSPVYLGPSALGEHLENPITQETYPEVNEIVKSTGGRFKHTNFGTIAHAFMEGKMQGKNPQINASDLIGLDNDEEKIRQVMEIAGRMAETFEQDPLYSKIVNAKDKFNWLRAEYDFRYKNENPDLKVIINGQIDLLVQTDVDKYLVVDYKTDQSICPEEHYAQLACYRQAVSQMMQVPAENVSCALYYLRFGESVDITQNCTETVFIEKAKKVLQEITSCK